MGAPTSLRLKSELLPGGLHQAIKHLSERIRRNSKDNFLEDLALLGRLRQASMSNHRRSGAVFTPYAIAEEIVKFVDLRNGDTVCDPAVGPGVFLLAAAERKMQLGESVSSICSTLRGVDLDPVSIEVARATLQLWAAWRGGVWPETDRLLVGDGLLDIPDEWHGTCDVVIGNPPFLGQLKSETSRDRSRAQALKQRFGSRYTAYVDESMLFFLLAVELISKDGRVSLIVPSSTLGSDSSQLAREWIDSRLALSEIWVGGRSVFDSAAVDVIAPILRSEKRDECTIVRYETQDALVVPRPLPGRWSSLLAHANGVPTVAIANTRRLGNRAVVTADFRDAYYWLAERVVEAVQNDDRPKLVTVGLVDPFCYRYGDVQTRFAKQRFQRPVVKIEDNPPTRLASWVEQRLIPKLLVATQTRIVECYADIKGELLPSTPLVTIIPEQESQLWHLMAAVSSPPASAWLASAAAGTGLSQGTMRLRASLIADLPLPELSKAWDLGAELAHEIQENGADDELLRRFGETMNQAYGFPSSELLHWWISQIPKKRP